MERLRIFELAKHCVYVKTYQIVKKFNLLFGIAYSKPIVDTRFIQHQPWPGAQLTVILLTCDRRGRYNRGWFRSEEMEMLSKTYNSDVNVTHVPRPDVTYPP